jgi:hypothetical protein
MTCDNSLYELFIGSVDMLALQQAASIALLRKPHLRFPKSIFLFCFELNLSSFVLDFSHNIQLC